MANKVLNQFQEQPESFSYCDFILANSQNIYTKVFALGMIEKKITELQLEISLLKF